MAGDKDDPPKEQGATAPTKDPVVAPVAPAPVAPITNITNVFKQKPEPFINKFHGLPSEKAAIHFMSWDDWLMCQLRIVDKDDFLTTFDGQISYFLCSLVGEARLWIQGRVFLSIDDLKKQFIKKFDKEPVYEADLKFLLNAKLPSNESISNFGEKLEQAARRINFDERALVKITLEKLPEACRRHLHGKHFNGFQDLIFNAESFMSAFPSIQSDYPPPAVHFHVDEQPQLEQHNQGGDLARLESQLQLITEQLQAYGISDTKERGRPRQKSPHPNKKDSDPDFDPRDLPHHPSKSKSKDRDGSHSRGRSPHKNESRGKSPHRSKSRGKSPHTTTRSCWNCGKTGHMYRDCRVKVEDSIGRRRDLNSLRSFLAEVDGHQAPPPNYGQAHAPHYSHNQGQNHSQNYGQVHGQNYSMQQHHGEAYTAQRSEHRFCCCGTPECQKSKVF